MKHISLPFLFVIGLMLWLSSYRSTWAQTAPASGSAICGIIDLTPAQAQLLQQQAMLAFKRKMGARKAFTNITYVPIRPHIIRRSNSTGGYPLASINQVIALTNQHYLVNGLGIQFYLAGTTPDYINDDGLYTTFPYGEGSIVNSYDSHDALNQYYVNTIEGGKGGYAYYPSDNIQSTRSFIQTYGETGNDDYLGNSTIPHELGHNFGLLHTFGLSNGEGTTDELVTRGSGANCVTAGDRLCDTPADPWNMPGLKLFYVGNHCLQYDPTSTTRDPGGDVYTPPVSNIMSYYNTCMHEFTPGQYDRIQQNLALRQSHTSYSLTAPATNVSPPTNLVASMNDLSVILTWQDNANNEMGYFIERSTSPNDGFVPVGGVAPDVTTFTDTQITAGTLYYYRIRPSNATTGSLSNNATTLVTGLTTTSISAFNAQLNWNGAGAGITYDVQWRAIGNSNWNTINSIQTNSYALYGLVMNTAYEWQVKTTSGSTYSGPVSFTTSCPTPNIYSSSITRTSVNLNFNGAYPQTYTLQWRQQGNPNWTTVNTATSSFYSLTGLSSSTVYEWQVQATCPGATTVTTAYSSPQSFTTLSCQTPTSPNTKVYSTAAFLAWNIANYESTTTYTVRYRPVDQPTWITVNGVASTSYSLTGLTTNTAYEWQVQRVCSPTESSIFTAPTTFTVACTVPYNLNSSPAASAASVNWSIRSTPETGASFEVQYRVIGSSSWTTVGVYYYGSAPVWGSSLTGLTVGTTYEWRVRTVCNATNQSDYSATATFTTVCNAPIASNFSVNQLTSTSAGFVWNVNSYDLGTRYDLRYRPVGAADWTTIAGPASTVITQYYSLTGLTNNTQYEWQVRSVCSETQSSTFTPGPTFTTQCSTPFAVTVDRRVISATIYWSSVAVDVSYEVRYRATGSGDWITLSNLTNSSVDLLGLIGNTNYEWQVKMYCSDGAFSDFSAISTFTTYGCEYPSSLYGYGLTPTSAKLTWSYLQADTESRYEARYRAVGATDWITISNLTSINLAGTYVLTGLTTGTQYEWQIKTLCSPTANSPFSPSLFFSPCAAMYTIRAGNWDDPGVWSCNRIPISIDTVQIKHIVTIPTSYIANAQKIGFDTGQKLSFGTNAQLKLGF